MTGGEETNDPMLLQPATDDTSLWPLILCVNEDNRTELFKQYFSLSVATRLHVKFSPND